jgi:hypothetical protein
MKKIAVLGSLFFLAFTSVSKAEFRGAFGVSAIETVFGLTAYRAEIGLPFNLSIYGEYDKGEADLKIVDLDYKQEFIGLRLYLLPWKDHEGIYIGAGRSDLAGFVDDDDVTGKGDALELGYTNRWGIFYASYGIRHTSVADDKFLTFPTSIGISIGF